MRLASDWHWLKHQEVFVMADTLSMYSVQSLAYQENALKNVFKNVSLCKKTTTWTGPRAQVG